MQALNMASHVISAEAGDLVRMRLPANGKKGKIVEKSLVAVGHEMARGARIVDDTDEPILAVRIPIRRKLGMKIEYDIEVFDAGPTYDVCFDPAAPPHLAMVLKA